MTGILITKETQDVVVKEVVICEDEEAFDTMESMYYYELYSNKVCDYYIDNGNAEIILPGGSIKYELIVAKC